MTQKPTVAELLTNPKLLRETAGRVLKPGPWKHADVIDFPPGCKSVDVSDQVWLCEKCGSIYSQEKPFTVVETDPEAFWSWCEGSCPIPDPATGSEADIAEALVKLFAKPSLEGLNLFAAILEVWSFVTKQSVKLGDRDVDDMMWFIVWATPTERIACCLLALGEAVITRTSP